MNLPFYLFPETQASLIAESKRQQMETRLARAQRLSDAEILSLYPKLQSQPPVRSDWRRFDDVRQVSGLMPFGDK